MKPPKKFRLVGQNFHVKTLPMKHHLGITMVDKQLVKLDSGQGEGSKRETYLHEAIHVMICKAALNKDVLLDAGVHESVAKRLTPLLLAFLCDNPAVYTYITGRRTK